MRQAADHKSKIEAEASQAAQDAARLHDEAERAHGVQHTHTLAQCFCFSQDIDEDTRISIYLQYQKHF